MLVELISEILILESYHLETKVHECFKISVLIYRENIMCGANSMVQGWPNGLKVFRSAFIWAAALQRSEF